MLPGSLHNKRKLAALSSKTTALDYRALRLETLKSMLSIYNREKQHIINHGTGSIRPYSSIYQHCVNLANLIET